MKKNEIERKRPGLSWPGPCLSQASYYPGPRPVPDIGYMVDSRYAFSEPKRDEFYGALLC